MLQRMGVRSLFLNAMCPMVRTAWLRSVAVTVHGDHCHVHLPYLCLHGHTFRRPTWSALAPAAVTAHNNVVTPAVHLSATV